MLAFVELVEHVFKIEGVTAFLSNLICHDHVENFLNNPSVAQETAGVGQVRERELILFK